MREILFKAKRVDNGEWIEEYYAECNGRTFIGIDISIYSDIFEVFYTPIIKWFVHDIYITVNIDEKDKEYEEAYANWAENIYAVMSYIMTTERKRVEKQRPAQKASPKKET